MQNSLSSVKVDSSSKEIKKTSFVVCKVFSTCRCNICGSFFEEGDDVCSLGHHKIGESYPIPA